MKKSNFGGRLLQTQSDLSKEQMKKSVLSFNKRAPVSKYEVVKSRSDLIHELNRA